MFLWKYQNEGEKSLHQVETKAVYLSNSVWSIQNNTLGFFALPKRILKFVCLYYASLYIFLTNFYFNFLSFFLCDIKTGIEY